MELLYGTHAQLIPHPADAFSPVSTVTDFLEKINESVQLAKDRYVIAKTGQATQANRRRCAKPDYQVGDLVYFNRENLCLRIKQQGHSVKFFPRFVEPFLILKTKLETSSYKLDLSAIYQWSDARAAWNFSYPKELLE